MIKKTIFSFRILIAAIILIVTSHNAKAVDVCASVTLTSENASQSCSATCGTAENWSTQWTNHSPGTTCSNNPTDSVCGCYLYPTCFCDKNGEQIANCLTPSSCPGGFSSCDCPKGTSCDDFSCQPNSGGTPCQRCNSNCLTFCQGVPIQGRADCQTSCFAQCESTVCKNTNAKGKLPQTKIPSQKETVPSKSSPLSKSKDIKSQDRKDVVPSTPLSSPQVKKMPEKGLTPKETDEGK